MTAAEELHTAKTPAEALMILARHIDELRAAQATEPADPWAQPLQWPAPVPDAEFDRVEINALKGLAVNATGEELEAIQARLRLLSDTPAAAYEVPEGRAETVVDTGDALEITLPPATPQRIARRLEWLQGKELHTMLDNTPLTEAQFADAYAKGGPLWLYESARQTVMTMPIDWRRDMVSDVLLDSPRRAQEIGRDILKSEAEASRDTAFAFAEEDQGA